MYLYDNPVLQRELIVSLRRKRSFFLLLAYLMLLSVIVYVAWPAVDESGLVDTAAAKRLMNLLFMGQLILASLLVPTFAAGTLSREKETKTYDLLFSTPVQPIAVVIGKLLGSLFQIVFFIFSAFPLVMLCLSLGGMSLYELLGVYTVLLLSLITFGSLCITFSTYFNKTMAALLVSYLVILPVLLIGITFWVLLGYATINWRLFVTLLVFPLFAVQLIHLLCQLITEKLQQPLEELSEPNEQQRRQEKPKSSALVELRRDRFPDWLLAPGKRDDCMGDHVNPVYDKEMRSEIFSQGAVTLRLVLQISMSISILLMSVFLYADPILAPWYVSYVLLFNLFIGPVFSASSMTSEYERETLDLLLTTTLSPSHLLWGKLFSGLRVSGVLTLFLIYPLGLTCVTWSFYWDTISSMGYYVAIILCTIFTTATIGMCSSLVFQKTSASLIGAYLFLGSVFFGPLVLNGYVQTFITDPLVLSLANGSLFLSPFAAAFGVPLDFQIIHYRTQGASWPIHWYFLGFYFVLDVCLITLLGVLFRYRWCVSR